MNTPTGVGLGLRIELATAMFADPEAPVDFVEIHPENFVDRGGPQAAMLERALALYPVVTHGLTMGFANLEAPSRDELTRLATFLDRVKAPFHSDHLCVARADGRFLHDLLPPPFERGTADVAVRRLGELADAIGRPVAVENVSYYVPRAEDPLREADLLVEVLERADARLLLDVNNVFVNAKNHGFDPRDYLARIPYERVVQIHVAGHLVRPDGLRIDTHAEPVPDPVFELLHEVLLRTGPVPVLLERDGNYPEWSELRLELTRLRQVYDRAMASRHADSTGSRDRDRRRALPEVPEPPRAGEPVALDAWVKATERTMLARDAVPALGEGLVAERWALQRSMVRSRLEELAALGLRRAFRRDADWARARLVDHLDRVGPRESVFHRLVEAFGADLHAAATDAVMRDAIALDVAEWRVRQAPQPADPDVDGVDFEQPPVVTRSRERLVLTHPVHSDALERWDEVEPSTVIVSLDREGRPRIAVLNDTAAALFDRLALEREPVAESLRWLVRDRGLATTELAIGALVDTLDHWIVTELLRGTRSAARNESPRPQTPT